MSIPPSILIIAYCAAVAGASLLGGLVPSLLKPTHMRMQLTMSFVGGLMLGVALLHLLPHAIIASGSIDVAVSSAVIGLLVMFAMIRVLHVHQHSHDPTIDESTQSCEHGDHDHGHAKEEETKAHAHDHGHHDHGHGANELLSHGQGWVGLFLGLALHTLIDGIALAASVAVGALEGGVGLIGLGTFFAILLHKPLDALSITSMMRVANWRTNWITAVNVTFALMCPIGALAFFFGIRGSGPMEGTIVGVALGVSAGVFLCISLADILPEVQFHHHDQGKLSLALLLGVVLAWGIGFLEPEHAHSHGGHSHESSGASHEDDHDHENGEHVH